MNNTLRAIRFETPDYVPMRFHINNACWHTYPQRALYDLMEAHPLLFPGFRRPDGYTMPKNTPVTGDKPYTDDFGCVWTNSMPGLAGIVTGHPLADWAAFEHWRCPDPEVCMGIGPVDWAAEKRRIDTAKATGEFVSAGLRHGHTFLQLCDLRGYENLLCDFADEDPRVEKLIEKVEWFNTEIVRHYLNFNIDMMCYGDDLGMQIGPMISPEQFRKYIKPTYSRMMKPARDKGVVVHMHSDGDIRLLADDLIDGGVEVINLQDLVNGIDWIAARFAGKVCVELDIDRQSITVYGTPGQIDALIREEVKKLGSRHGGLMMVYGLYPGVPLENVGVLMDAMEKYAFYYS